MSGVRDAYISHSLLRGVTFAGACIIHAGPGEERERERIGVGDFKRGRTVWSARVRRAPEGRFIPRRLDDNQRSKGATPDEARADQDNYADRALNQERQAGESNWETRDE